MEAQTVTELSNRISGDVITPDRTEYETSRRVLNRVGSPAVIVRAESVEDIVTALHIARDLAVTERTVKFHLSALMRKLGVSNRVEAVSTAIRLGLIDLPA